MFLIKNKYPWMAAIRMMDPSLSNGNLPWCGGTLVASKYVITAAHCLFTRGGRALTEKDFNVRLGEHNTHGSLDIPEVDIAVEKLIKHPQFNGDWRDSNDIAVIKLAEEANMKLYTPVCLATTSDDNSFYDKKAQVYQLSIFYLVTHSIGFKVLQG